jgi:hypothetical protein
LMPLIMFIALGGIFSTSISTTREASKNISIIVVDQDMGTVSSALKAFLQNASGFKFRAYYVDNLEGALSSLSIYNASGVVLLPRVFHITSRTVFQVTLGHMLHLQASA